MHCTTIHFNTLIILIFLVIKLFQICFLLVKNHSLLFWQVEILVETGRQDLKPLQLSDCDFSQRPGMYLEILPKVIFETVETDAGIEEVDFPKPIFRSTIDQGTIVSNSILSVILFILDKYKMIF